MLAHEAEARGANFVDRKNEAIFGGVEWDLLASMEVEEGGGAREVGFMLTAAGVLE